MAVATFDTLKFANTLKAAGVPDKQAEGQAVAFPEVIQINLKDLVTKDDLKQEIDNLRKDLKQEIADVRRDVKDTEQRLGARIDVLAAEQKATKAELKGERSLIKWMFGAVMIVGIAVIGLLLRVLVVLGR